MTVALTTRCPHCRGNVPAHDEQLLSEVVCPQCSQSFKVQSLRPRPAASDTDASPLVLDTIAAKAPQPVPSQSPPPTAGTLPRSAKASALAASEPTKETLGRFQLKNLLGAGGFAVVWRAYDPLLERYVALKLPRFGADDEQQVRRFLNEAKTAARLRHPNIVAIYESGQVGQRLFLASELVVGQPLSKVIATERPALPTAVAWVRDLALALDYAHKEGVIHRDIKPHNILVDQRGRPQITDFGLAREIDRDSTLTTEGTVLGTPAYMSPEQARADVAGIGPATDQYSLGVVLYELLTGRRPFDGEPHVVVLQVLKDEPPAPRHIDPALPRDLEAVCLKAIDKEVHKRYGSAADFAADLARWLNGEPVSARPVRPWERMAKWARRNPAISSLAATVVLVIGVALASISLALASSISSAHTARAALADAEEQKDIATGLASDLESKNSELQSAVAVARAEEAKALSAKRSADSALLDARKAKDEATAALQKAVEEERIKQQVLQRLADSSAALAQKIRELEEAIRDKEVAEKQIVSQGREAAMKLVQAYWDQALSNYQDGQYPEANRLLALAIQQLPDTNKPDSSAWSQRLRMALALEMAGQPRIVSQQPWPAEIVDLRQVPASLSELYTGGFANPALAPTRQLVVDGTGAIAGDEAHRLSIEGSVLGVVPLPSDSLLREQFLVAYNDKPARLIEFRRAKPGAAATAKALPFLAEDTQVSALEYGLDRVLATALWAHGQASVRIDWTTIESVVAGRPPVVGHYSKSMRLPPDLSGQRIERLCRGPGRTSVAIAAGSRVTSWEASTEKKLGTFSADAPVSAIAFSRAFQLVVVTAGPHLHLLEWPELSAACDPISHSEPIIDLVLSPGGQTAHIADQQGRLTSIDLAGRRALCQPSAGRNSQRRLLVRADAQVIAAGGARLREWQMPQGAELLLPALPPVSISRNDSPALADRVAFPDGAEFVIVARDKIGSTWWPDSRDSSAAMAGSGGAFADPADAIGEMQVYGPFELPLAIAALACHPTEPLVAAACTNGIRLYVPLNKPTSIGRNWRPDGILRDRDEKDLNVTCLAFDPDRRWLASGNDRGFVRLWNLEKRVHSKEWKTASGVVRGLAFSRSGGRLAAISDATVEVYDLARGERLPQSLPVADGRAVAISPDGRMVIAGGGDGTSILWNVDADAPIGEPLQHSQAVTAVAFDSLSGFAYAAGGEGVQAIHASTGLPAGRFLRELRDTTGAAFSASGNRLFLAGRIYTLPRPIDGPADRMLSTVAESAGTKLDASGNFVWEHGR